MTKKENEYDRVIRLIKERQGVDHPILQGMVAVDLEAGHKYGLMPDVSINLE